MKTVVKAVIIAVVATYAAPSFAAALACNGISKSKQKQAPVTTVSAPAPAAAPADTRAGK